MALVVLGAAIAAWWLWSGMTAPVAEDGDGTVGRRIRSASSSPSGKRGLVLVATNKAVKTAAIGKPEVEHVEVFMKPKVEGRLIVWKTRGPPPVFTNNFESYVATILTSTPGERFLVDEVNEGFDESFREALKNDIVIDPNDSEDVAELKRAVIESKEEVRRQVAEGQKPSEIVEAALKEMNKIADYRDQVQEAFNHYLETETDPKEVLKYQAEANAMLDEYGALHIEGPCDEDDALEMMIIAKEGKAEQLTESLGKGEEK